MKHSFATAELPSTLEPSGFSISNAKRPDGLTLLPYSRGKALVWDFTCVHRLAATYTGLGNHAGATVAELAESKKLRTYQELEQNYIVQPIAIESLGGIGPDSFKFLKNQGKRMSFVPGNTLEPAFLRQRLAIAGQRGNAACILENLQSLYSDNKTVNLVFIYLFLAFYYFPFN